MPHNHGISCVFLILARWSEAPGIYGDYTWRMCKSIYRGGKPRVGICDNAHMAFVVIVMTHSDDIAFSGI